MSCDFNRPEEPFLSLEKCLVWLPLAEERKVSEVARGPNGFFTAYIEAEGKKSDLSCWWRKRRSNFCHRHWIQIEENEGGKLFEDSGKYSGLPTRHALSLIMWAWHPDPRALARSVEILNAYNDE